MSPITLVTSKFYGKILHVYQGVDFQISQTQFHLGHRTLDAHKLYTPAEKEEQSD